MHRWHSRQPADIDSDFVYETTTTIATDEACVMYTHVCARVFKLNIWPHMLALGHKKKNTQRQILEEFDSN